jgi:hypothetical protein
MTTCDSTFASDYHTGQRNTLRTNNRMPVCFAVEAGLEVWRHGIPVPFEMA